MTLFRKKVQNYNAKIVYFLQPCKIVNMHIISHFPITANFDDDTVFSTLSLEDETSEDVKYTITLTTRRLLQQVQTNDALIMLQGCLGWLPLLRSSRSFFFFSFVHEYAFHFYLKTLMLLLYNYI